MKRFPTYRQPDAKDCGPTCLKTISKYYNKSIALEQIRNLSETYREGTNLQNLSNAAETIGFKSLPVKFSLNKLKTAPLPCILLWNQNHYTVLYKIKHDQFYLSDPAVGLVKYSEKEFLTNWIFENANNENSTGIALLMEPTLKFYEFQLENNEKKLDWSFITLYFIKYKKFIFQLIIGLITGSLLQLIFPFLVQSIVDVGIRNQDLHFIYLILFAQLFLFIGKTSVEVLRGWLLLHISTRINISLISDFFLKLMKLPMSFFDSRITGDILQRINDHKRIERAMTVSSLNILFSFFNIILFGLVLLYYNLIIFGIFVTGTILYILWITLFLKKRRILDYQTFILESEEHSKNIELINGMQEIKLNNWEHNKRWNWEQLQARIFKVSLKTLALEQYQSVGSGFINELKNILVTVLAAKLVIDGDITLGMMLAISYIIGQLNSPVILIINFIKEAQDAKISMERLSEIHNLKNEESTKEYKIHDLEKNSNIQLSNLSFRYKGSNKYVLKDLNLEIPSNKITAIVGSSGSGKSTLMKLILKFYHPTKGKIKIGKHNLANISQKVWREECGAVMQEGFIFQDTIANNIGMGENKIDKLKLLHAVEVANAKEFIEELPLSYNTTIGTEGIGLSVGQKQRILIARAVYKNPNYLFFDESTSALDSENEREIMNNLKTFFIDKTVVIIAHRLSTVKNADQIVVLDNGKIIEKGTHDNLVNRKGYYFNLIKNQLELGL